MSDRRDILISRRLRKHRYLRRFFLHLAVGTLITILFLFLGMWGYHHFEGMDWIDSYANAAMILSGMGPLGNLQTTDGKLFAGTYAIMSGVGYLVIMTVIFIPIFHLLLHTFHFEEE